MATRERRTREKVARRETILKAAKDIFVEKGLLASTIDEIAARAEVAKGTIYLYFKSKEEIWAALLAEGLTLVTKRFTEAIDLALPADENLRRLCDAYCRVYREEPQYFKLLFLCSHADVRAKTCAAPSECPGMPPLALLFQKGIDEGTFAPTVDPSQAAAIAWASSNGIVLMFEQNPDGLEALLKTNIELLIRGLRATNPG
ncbi:MAG: TetR/AcrR family transcriptional regulator [Candidatus Rokubacteria bacterium]|nr:TetR/AcrR family transcriptional regulator [Candidatus Rokubacteria bacterium]